MLLGRCCKCEDHPAITLKGINSDNGTTIWEYGPGSWWRQQPSVDYVFGLVPDLGGTKTRYAIAPVLGAETSPVRATGVPAANVFEGITLTKLDSTLGTVSTSSVVEGMFVTNVTASSFSLAPWIRIDDTVTLSGGGFLVMGFRKPAVEYVAFTLNTASKTYILHAHTQQGGTVTLKTRTSDESIVLNYNDTAASVKTAFEATADCTAATCTGGPWPHRSIQVDATWSVSTGDLKSISASDTYTVSGTVRSVNGAAATYDVATGLISNSIGYVFGRTTSHTPSKLINVAGTIPTYSAQATCAAARMVADAGFDRVVIKAVKDTSSTGSSDTIDCWTVADPWTRDWQKWTNIGPAATGSDFYNLTSQQNDIVCVHFPNRSFSGNERCAATISISGGTVTEIDRSDAVSLATAYDQNNATAWFTDGDSTNVNIWRNELTVTDSERPNVRFENHLDGKEFWHSTNTYLLGLVNGGMTATGWAGSNDGGMIGADSSNIYGLSTVAGTTVNYGQPLRNPTVQIADDKEYLWTFYMLKHRRLKTGTEWRFRFGGGAAYTSWLDWNATATQIHTAIIAAVGENTGGVFSNAEVYPFGEPAGPTHSTVNTIEKGLTILFHGAGNANGVALGYIPSGWVSAGSILIQFQAVVQYNTAGISAWNKSDGTVRWQRIFGVSAISGQNVTYPSVAWTRPNMLICGGPLVDPD